jgi:hypothetical protein
LLTSSPGLAIFEGANANPHFFTCQIDFSSR